MLALEIENLLRRHEIVSEMFVKLQKFTPITFFSKYKKSGPKSTNRKHYYLLVMVEYVVVNIYILCNIYVGA